MWRRQWALSLARAFLVASLGVILVASAVDAAPWAWMGVRIRDLAEQEMDDIAKRHGIREGFGVVVVEVMEGTPITLRRPDSPQAGIFRELAAAVRRRVDELAVLRPLPKIG